MNCGRTKRWCAWSYDKLLREADSHVLECSCRPLWSAGPSEHHRPHSPSHFLLLSEKTATQRAKWHSQQIKSNTVVFFSSSGLLKTSGDTCAGVLVIWGLPLIEWDDVWRGGEPSLHSPDGTSGTQPWCHHWNWAGELLWAGPWKPEDQCNYTITHTQTHTQTSQCVWSTNRLELNRTRPNFSSGRFQAEEAVGSEPVPDCHVGPPSSSVNLSVFYHQVPRVLQTNTQHTPVNSLKHDWTNELVKISNPITDWLIWVSEHNKPVLFISHHSFQKNVEKVLVDETRGALGELELLPHVWEVQL